MAVSAVPGYQVPFGNLLQKRAQNLRPATSQRVPLFLACQSTVAMVFPYPIKEGVQSRLPKSGPIWIPDCLFLKLRSRPRQSAPFPFFPWLFSCFGAKASLPKSGFPATRLLGPSWIFPARTGVYLHSPRQKRTKDGGPGARGDGDALGPGEKRLCAHHPTSN